MELTKEQKDYCIEIYKEVLEKAKKQDYCGYLCLVIDDIEEGYHLDIRTKFYGIALEYFEEQRPQKDKHKKFYNHKMYIKPVTKDVTVWWLVYNSYVTCKDNGNGQTNVNHFQRENFLEYLIKILEDDLS